MKIDLDFFENIIAYKLLTDSVYMTTVADYLQPFFFENAHISTVVEIIKHFYDVNNKLPTLTEVKLYLETDEQRAAFVKTVHAIKDIDKDISIEELYRNTEYFLKRRALYHAILDTAKKIDEADEVAVIEKFNEISNICLVNDFGIELFRDIDKVVDDLGNKAKSISTGWDFLDRNLGGGFIENGRSIYVFVGETNIGKSIVLGNVAVNLAKQGKNVLLITLEMSEMVYAKRLCSTVTSIPGSQLASETKTLKQLMIENRRGGIIIKEFPPSTVTAQQLQGFVKRLLGTGVKIDAIVLDYINLLNPAAGNGLYEKIKYLTEKVRAMSYIFNCPIITASQLNRSGIGVVNPKVDTISESVGMAATADVIISIFQTEEDRELGIIRFGLPKNRYGPRDICSPMKIIYETLTILDTGIEEKLSEIDDALDSLAMFSDG